MRWIIFVARCLEYLQQRSSELESAEEVRREHPLEPFGGQFARSMNDTGVEDDSVERRAAFCDRRCEHIHIANEAQIGADELDVFIRSARSQLALGPMALGSVAPHDDRAMAHRG
jgi:hypothetical protein